MKMYGAGDIDKFVRDIERYTIGMDEWLHRMGAVHETKENYPPYNLIKLDNISFKLELALLVSRKKEINVYTENNKLFVEGKAAKKEELEYIHKGLASRDFTRVWTFQMMLWLMKLTMLMVYLSIVMRRIIPEHQKKRIDWIINNSEYLKSSQTGDCPVKKAPKATPLFYVL